MKTTKTKSGFLFIIAALAIALCAGTASATDAKLYPGSMCVDFQNSHNARYYYSSIANGSATTELALDCVTVRDAAGVQGAWIKVIDQSYDKNVSCTLFSAHVNATGSFAIYTASASSTGSGASVQNLTYPGLSYWDDGYYYFSCSIPRTYSANQSRIVNYKVAEND